jgi:hypothetical protein
MKNILAMMFGSASVSLLNLASLTLVVARVDLAELDAYFLYRDVGESLLKLFFISQIGALSVSAIRMWNGSLVPARWTLIYGGVITSAAMIIWAAYFHVVAPHFLPESYLLPTGGFSTFEIAVAVFCVFVWLDSASSPVIINAGRFWIYHVSNFCGAAVTCLGITLWEKLAIEEVALAFAAGRVVAAIPKLTLCFLLSSPPESKRPDGISNTFRMAVTYIPLNSLQQLNRFAFLSGVAFLQPGAFALFSVFNRYYTALQNLVTMNLFHLSASRLSKSQVDPKDLHTLIFQHKVSFLLVVISACIFMYLTTLPEIKPMIPEFLTTGVAPILWCLVLLSFLPDGLNLILSRSSIFQGETNWDSRVSMAQVLVNTVLLYPSMKYFGVYGLAYSTFFVVSVFAIIRCWRMVQFMPELKPLIIPLFIYGFGLISLAAFLANKDLADFCLGMTVASMLALLHVRWRLR